MQLITEWHQLCQEKGFQLDQAVIQKSAVSACHIYAPWCAFNKLDALSWNIISTGGL